MRRLGDFLSLPEPPEPWHARSRPAAADSNGPAAAGSGKLGRRRSSDAAKKQAAGGGHGAANSHGLNDVATNGHAAAVPEQQQGAAAETAPVVQVAGADFDWADRSWARPAGAATAAQAASPTGKGAETELAATAPAEAAPGDAKVAVEAVPGSPKAGDSAAGGGFQLRDLRFEASKGQLVGIVGAVGSGEDEGRQQLSGGGKGRLKSAVSPCIAGSSNVACPWWCSLNRLHPRLPPLLQARAACCQFCWASCSPRGSLAERHRRVHRCPFTAVWPTAPRSPGSSAAASRWVEVGGQGGAGLVGELSAGLRLSGNRC